MLIDQLYLLNLMYHLYRLNQNCLKNQNYLMFGFHLKFLLLLNYLRFLKILMNLSYH
jgi:hypothetical protein